MAKTREEWIKQGIDEGDITVIDDGEMTKRYRDFLDEVNGPVCIGTLEYCASRVLEEVDPIAFNCGFSDWTDAEWEIYEEIEDGWAETREIDDYIEEKEAEEESEEE